MKLLFTCLILGFAQLEAFKIPFPFERGVIDNRMSRNSIVDHGIFNRLLSAIKPFVANPEEKVSRQRGKFLTSDILLLKP